MDRGKYKATPEAVARVLLLIDSFSHVRGGRWRELEGRVKLAKLDFLLRYPKHLSAVLRMRGVPEPAIDEIERIGEAAPIDSRMMRYRYGPWDPSYYAILGSLIGRGLVATLPLPVGGAIGFRTTERGTTLASEGRADGAFATVDKRAEALRKHLDLTGSGLTKLIYRLPGISSANWEDELS